MQQFQNYYPMYQNSYGQQMQNPYMQQRMDNLQQFQQAINQPQMAQNQFNPFGKMVESIDIVKVTDIPMDGNMYYFPQADGQAIYGKKFLPNGQTQILAYKPILDDDPNTLSNDDEKLKFDLLERVTDLFQENISSVNDRLDKIEKYLKPTKAKKEDGKDE